MPVKPSLIAAFALALSTPASANEGFALFKFVLFKDGQVVASPSIFGAFGSEVSLEVPQLVRVAAIASAPNREGHSFTAVRLSVYEGGAMQPPREASMVADLTKDPSLDYAVPGTSYRLQFTPRKVTLPKTDVPGVPGAHETSIADGC